jgi:hypothetical protein
MDELIENISKNNGEFSTAIALLVSLMQKLDAKLGDPNFSQAVTEVKAYVKGTDIAGREPPGCKIGRFDDLPPGVRGVLGEGWRDFFEQDQPPA